MTLCHSIINLIFNSNRNRFTSKSTLYKLIDEMREALNISLDDYPIDINEIIKNLSNFIVVEYPILESNTLGGLIQKMKPPLKSVIIINAAKPKPSQEFTLSHELIHFWLHPSKEYLCKELRIDKDSYEYQANEGAAELLIPYKILIPYVSNLYYEFVELEKHNRETEALNILWDMTNFVAYKFNVSPVIADYRINSLKYEIAQYIQGTPINDIEIISKYQQERRGVNKIDIVNLARKEFSGKIPPRGTCAKCNSLVTETETFCLVCGERYPGRRKIKGMIYNDGYILNENSKLLKCPVCENEEIDDETYYCIVCKTYLYNYCTNDDYGYNACGKPMPGNARYCKYCGAETTFFQNKLLRPWSEVKDSILAKQEAVASKDQLIEINLTTNILKSLKEWGDILHQIRESGRMAIYTNLMDTEALYDVNTVYIKFGEGSTFKKMLISKEQNIEIIEKHIYDHINKRMKIKLIDKQDETFISKAKDISQRFNMPLDIIDE